MRAVIGLLGLFSLAIGLGFLFAPDRLAAGFFLTVTDPQGLATLRADFPGFFIGAAIFALLGAWTADPRPLMVPMVLLGLALFGRCISLVADGIGPSALEPMVVEAVMIGLLFAARRQFGGRA